MPATTPSAAPNPVMLRIIGNRASYGATRTLSIREGPSHAVQVRLPRTQEAGNLLRVLPSEIAQLPVDHRVGDADLELRRDRVVHELPLQRAGRDPVPAARRKAHVG